jgi:hypothetical protein
MDIIRFEPANGSTGQPANECIFEIASIYASLGFSIGMEYFVSSWARVVYNRLGNAGVEYNPK